MVVSFARRATLVLIAPALLAVLGAASAQGLPAPDSPVCKVAAGLLERDHPDDALAVIEAARKDGDLPAICSEEEKDAAHKAKVAFGLLNVAEEKADAAAKLTSTDKQVVSAAWKSVLDAATAVLAVDAENAAAIAIRDDAKPKVDAPPTDHNVVTRLETDESEWKKFKESVVDPASTLVLAGLAIALAIAVAARLLLLVWPRRWPRLDRATIGWTAVLGTIGVLVSAASPWWLSSDGTTFSWTIACYLISAVAWAVVLGSRMRLTVEARNAEGDDDPAAATQIIAMLRELGGEPPAGLEVPQGTDVEILNGKAITDVKNGWLAAALTAVQAILGVTPWRVVVDSREGGEAYAVMTRNGKSAGSAVILSKPLGLDGPEVDPLKMAAAFVLMTLSQGYRSGFDGLSGAQDWRGVGWQYAATSEARDQDARIQLLIAAVDADPQNLPAQVAFRYLRDRSIEDPRRQKSYASWLVARAETLNTASDQTRYLRIRLLHTATAVTLNRAIALDPELQVSAFAVARDRARILLEAVLALPKHDVFRASMLPVAEVLDAIARNAEPPPGVTAGLGSTTLDYDLACHYARRGRPREALDRLASVMTVEVGRAEVSNDPFLKELAASDEFLTRYPGEPRTNLLEIEPYKSSADALKAAGITTIDDLSAPSLSLADLASDLDNVLLARRLRGLAAIAQLAPKALSGQRLEVLEALAAEGVAAPADVPAAVDDLVATVLLALRKRAILLTPAEQRGLREWLIDVSRA